MPLLILLGIAALAGGISAYENRAPRNTKPFTRLERERIMGEMVGKSKRECRAILRKYRR